MRNKEVICEQPKALKAKILVILLMVLCCFVFVSGEATWYEAVLMGMPGLLFFSYKRAYHITKDFKNYTMLSFFGIPFLKKELKLEFPDYISIFSTSFSQSNEWGTVSALGSKRSMDAIVIRFFKENRHSTLYRTKVYKEAKDVAHQLEALLNVKVHDHIAQ